jgi:hypothetical protein
MNVPNERTPATLLLLVLILAIVTRIGGLSEGFWIDEVISSDTAAMPWGELLARAGLADVHPPGYYLGLKFWGLFAGSSDLASRLFTLLVSVLTVGLLTVYARTRFGNLASVVAGMTLALSPLHAHYGVEVRSYALLTGLTLAAIFCQERLLARPRCARRQVLLVLVLSALTWVHTLGLIVAGLVLVHAFLSAPASMTPILRAISICVASLFTPWLPLLLVQVFHQPDGMTAHLSSPLSWMDLAAGLGPSALWPMALLPAILGGAVWLMAAWGLWGLEVPGAQDVEAKPARAWWVVSCVTGVSGPLLALTLLPLSPLTFDLIAGEVGLAYGLWVLSVLGIAALARLRPSLPTLKLSAPATLFLGYLLVLFALHGARPILNIRNLLPMVPLALLGLGACVGGRPRAAVGVALVWVGLSASSLAALADREADGPIPARDDLRGAAMLVDDPGSTVVVIPRWDAPGVSRYLDPDREVRGALDPGELDLSRASRVTVVLTRSAAAVPEPYLSALKSALSGRLQQVERRRLRGSPAVEVVRYAPAKDHEAQEPKGARP